MTRPLIGITIPNKRWHWPAWFIALGVWIGGGRPVFLRYAQSAQKREVDGIILGGGTDIFPGLYKDRPKTDYLYDHERDTMEIDWLKKANAMHIPVLGICRGAQIMNVMRGGSLHMDVALAYKDAHYPRHFLRRIFFRKEIQVEKKALLYRITNKEYMRVNSIHSQAINKTGKGLVVTAREKNGVIQAVENPAHPFYLGVQFHPEFMLWRASMRAIFSHFVKAARSPRGG
jgi:putative glutamine amidotransferase